MYACNLKQAGWVRFTGWTLWGRSAAHTDRAEFSVGASLGKRSVLSDRLFIFLIFRKRRQDMIVLCILCLGYIDEK